MNRSFSLVVVLAFALAGGCSSFKKDYEAAVVEQTAFTDITGPWVGTWKSNGGHEGELRAIISKIEEDRYLARYHAKYGWLGSFEQNIVLSEVPSEQPEVRHFIGASDLGWPWGVYHYNAKSTPTAFNSTYRSEKDEGAYTLRRP